MGDPPISLRNLTKRFGSLSVLEGVTFDIPKGQTTAIIGPSGTGKSVLLKHIVGLLRPDEGEVRVFGTNMATAAEGEVYAVRKRLGMLFQDGALFDSLSAGENIEFPLRQHHASLSVAERRERVEEALEMVELPGLYDRPTPALSGGQRKRIGLARAIITRPELILFDEPNSGLDPITSDAIDALIGHLKESLGVTFVVVTHDIVGTINVADHIAMLHQGRLVAWGTKHAVTHSEDPIVRRFFSRNLVLSPEGDPRPATLPHIGGARTP